MNSTVNTKRNPYAKERRAGPYGVLTCFGVSDDHKSVMVRYKGGIGTIETVRDWTALPAARLTGAK